MKRTEHIIFSEVENFKWRPFRETRMCASLDRGAGVFVQNKEGKPWFVSRFERS